LEEKMRKNIKMSSDFSTTDDDYTDDALYKTNSDAHRLHIDRAIHHNSYTTN